MIIYHSKIHEKMGNIEKAIETLVEGRADIVNQLAQHENLADLYLIIGDKDKAIDELE